MSQRLFLPIVLLLVSDCQLWCIVASFHTTNKQLTSYFPLNCEVVATVEQAGRTNPYVVLLLQQTLWPLQGFCNVLIYLRPRVASVRKIHPDISYSLALYVSLFDYDSIERTRRMRAHSSEWPNTSSRRLSSKKHSIEKRSISIEIESEPSQEIAQGERQDVRKSLFEQQEQSWDDNGAFRNIKEAMEDELPA